MEVKPHLVSNSALVGHDELREIARNVQAIRFHFFHCPAPTIACLRLKEVERQGCRLWIYNLCCERHLWFSFLWIGWLESPVPLVREPQLSRDTSRCGSAWEYRRTPVGLVF